MATTIGDQLDPMASPAKMAAATTTPPTVKQADTNQATANLIDVTKVPQYTATQAGAASGTAAQSTAATGAATTRTVGNDETVNGLLAKYIDPNSPLMQQAQTAARQSAQSRGLLNSSMAVGAGQQAVYNTALPMAQQDAQTYSAAARDNQVALNAQTQQNVGNQQQTNLSNTAAVNSQTQQNVGNQQQSNVANQQSTNQAQQYNAGLISQVLQQNAQTSTQTNQFNTQQSNAQSQFNASQTNDILKTQLDMSNRQDLANIEANYKTLMQANASAGELYQQAVKNITEIQGNKDMTAETKTSAINAQLQYLRTGINLVAKMDSIPGLTDIITSIGSTSGASTATTTPTTATTTPAPTITTAAA